jgi:two-component system, OmpR family, KDP operon response regulator KdpE
MRRIVVASSASEKCHRMLTELALEGYQVKKADETSEIISAACSGEHDALIVDSVVNGTAAYELCRKIRQRSKLGIIVLGGEQDVGMIDALNAGADDYVASPFPMAELVACLRALLRRIAPTRCAGQIVLQDRTIDLESRKITGPSSEVGRLTPKEFMVLQCLLNHGNRPRTHQSLAQTVWQRDGRGEVEFVRIVVRQLRRKLESDPRNPRYILTERSVGYRFQVPSGCRTNR